MSKNSFKERGRPKGRPNRKCKNCAYWNGPRKVKKGSVAFDSCIKKNVRIPSEYKCGYHVYFKKIRKDLWFNLLRFLIKIKRRVKNGANKFIK